MAHRTKFFKVTAFCVSTLLTQHLCASDSRSLRMNIILLKALEAANGIIKETTSSEEERAEAEKRGQELTAHTAQLTDQHRAMEHAKQIMQRMQSHLTTKAADPSFNPSPEEYQALLAEMEKTMGKLMSHLPAEEHPQGFATMEATATTFGFSLPEEECPQSMEVTFARTRGSVFH